MLRKVVEHALIEKLDPDAPAQSAEEGAVVAQELARQNPELAPYILPENLEVIETRLAGQPVTLNTFREAVLSLAAAGKLETQETLDAATKEAERVVQERLRPKPVRDKETGRFVISEDFRQQYNRMSTAEIKRRYFSDPEFKKRVDALEGIPAPAPKAATSEEPVSLTAQEWRSLPSHVVQRKMNSSAAFRAAVDRLIQERQI